MPASVLIGGRRFSPVDAACTADRAAYIHEHVVRSQFEEFVGAYVGRVVLGEDPTHAGATMLYKWRGRLGNLIALLAGVVAEDGVEWTRSAATSWADHFASLARGLDVQSAVVNVLLLPYGNAVATSNGALQSISTAMDASARKVAFQMSGPTQADASLVAQSNPVEGPVRKSQGTSGAVPAGLGRAHGFSSEQDFSKCRFPSQWGALTCG